MELIHPYNILHHNDPYEVVDYAFEVNQFNINTIIPKLNKHKIKNELEGFLISEHIIMSRQFRVISILLNNIRILNFDSVDCSISIASLTRTIIENMALINFLIHDTEFTKEEKLQEIINFQTIGKKWYEQHSNKNIQEIAKHDSIKLFNKFLKENHKAIKQNLWAKIQPNKKTLSSLINGFKFSIPLTDKVTITNDQLFNIWDGFSKFLHNNPLYRLAYWQKSQNNSCLNYDMYKYDFDQGILTMSRLFLYASLNDLIVEVNNDELTNLYQEGLKKVETIILNKKVKKIS